LETGVQVRAGAVYRARLSQIDGVGFYTDAAA
jgi:hypothetical protein